MLFAQDPLEGASKAFARGNADVAMIAVAPFRTVQGTAWVIGAEFVEEVERGGFRLGCGCFFRGKSEFACCLRNGFGNGSVHPFFGSKDAQWRHADGGPWGEFGNRVNDDDLDVAVAQDVGNFDETLLKCKGFFFWSGVQNFLIRRAEGEIVPFDVTIGCGGNDHVLRFEFNEMSQGFRNKITASGVFLAPVPQAQVGKGA